MNECWSILILDYLIFYSHVLGPYFHQVRLLALPEKLWQIQIVPMQASGLFHMSISYYRLRTQGLSPLADDRYIEFEVITILIVHDFSWAVNSLSFAPRACCIQFSWISVHYLFSQVVFISTRDLNYNLIPRRVYFIHTNFGTLCYYTRGSRFIFSVKSVD